MIIALNLNIIPKYRLTKRNVSSSDQTNRKQDNDLTETYIENLSIF